MGVWAWEQEESGNFSEGKGESGWGWRVGSCGKELGGEEGGRGNCEWVQKKYELINNKKEYMKESV